MRRSARLGFIMLFGLFAAACSTGRYTTRTADVEEERPETTLLVENQSTLQVTIYVHREAHRQRLGTASALSSTRLRIPDGVLFGPTNLRFEADPLGSRAQPISESIMVVPGQQVRLIIPSSLR